MDLITTERAIMLIKQTFQKELAAALGLTRVSAPLYVDAASGIQDNLNGIERPVAFEVAQTPGRRFEIVHSLAKWKRYALADYGFRPGTGLYTDMNALRPDEADLGTGLHSVYVDQWDWERVIEPADRGLDTLEATVRAIWRAVKETEAIVAREHGVSAGLADDIQFVHTEELLERWPDLSHGERESRICRELGAVFLIGIGGALADGKPHDGRAPDYDDWSTETGPGRAGLNGDILVWNSVLERGFELSSMGIRVDAEAMTRQLKIRGCQDRGELPWHQMLLSGQLPDSIGGGIGQSRLCMLLLRKRHIGEVQVSVWPPEVQQKCEAAGIRIL